MGQYLVTRAEGAPPNTTAVDALSGTVFFQLWQVRADPLQGACERGHALVGGPADPGGSMGDASPQPSTPPVLVS